MEVLKDEESLSVDEMIANLQTNQQTIETMASNMGALRDRFAQLGLDTAVLDQFDTMGIEAAADVANLVMASDEQLQALATTFGDAATTSTDALYNNLGSTAAEKIPDAIRNLVETTKTGLAEQIQATDWSELGEAEIEGIVEGVEGMTDDAVTAVTNVAKEQYRSIQSENQSHSPSKKYEAEGTNMILGLMKGVSNYRGPALNLMRSLAITLQAPYKALKSVFAGYGSDAMQGFINGMEGRRGDVIATAGSIANDASSTISSALQIGSPSRLLEKYGAWGIKGLENGMESREKNVKKITQRIADVMASIFIPNMSDYSYSGDLALSGGFTYHMDGLRDDIGELVETINTRPIIVQNDLIVNGRSFAKSTTTYITQEQKSQAQLAEYIEGVR